MLDPGGLRTADPRNPGSWNRYAYVNGDPVNFMIHAGSRQMGRARAAPMADNYFAIWTTVPGALPVLETIPRWVALAGLRVEAGVAEWME